MKIRNPHIAIVLALLAISVSVIVTLRLLPARPADCDKCEQTGRIPNIRPDYTDIMIPPNIAPLNFAITEPSDRYFVKIHSELGETIEIASRNPKIIIPIAKWHKLLQQNRGNQLYFDIFTADKNKKWKRSNGLFATQAHQPCQHSS